MAYQIELRIDTAANWTAANHVLGLGEKGIESDTGQEKVGDGSTAWNGLKYVNPGKITNVGSVGQSLVRAAGGGATWTTLQIASFLNVIIDTPENHGAKGDGKTVTNAAFTTGGVMSMADTSQGSFTAGDVGKKVMANGAGSNGAGNVYIGTINGFTDATHVSVTPAPARNISSVIACYGTDDTAAINAAIASVVSTGQSTGAYYGEVWFNARIYIVAGALDRTQHGNAQIPIPFQSPTGQKFTLVLKGTTDNTALTHWTQPLPQQTGAVLVSALYPAYSGTFGIPSCIGGPTNEQGYGFANNGTFNNMLVVWDGLTITLPKDPSQHGLDGGALAELNVPNMGVFTLGTVVGGDWWPNYAPTQFYYGSTYPPCGLVMPGLGNNDESNIGLFSAEGMNGCVALGEHSHAESIRCISSSIGVTFTMAADSTANADHSMSINYLSTEECRLHIYDPGGSFVATMLNILNWDPEDQAAPGTETHISATGAHLRGEININTLMIVGGLIVGSTGVHIRDVKQAPGAHPYLWDTTTASLSTGGAITSIPIGPLKAAVPAGTFVIDDGAGHTQTWTTTGAAMNASTVPVTSQTPNFAYPSGSLIKIPMPNTTVAYKNPFWRDAAVSVSGGTVTVISVDGMVTGLTSGTVFVPSGKSITLTYSAAPSWAWVLL